MRLTTVMGGLVCAPCVQAYSGWPEGALPKVVSDSNSRKLLNDARRGDASAQRELGKMLIQGALIKRDIPNGVKWLKMSAEQGDAGAMLILGDLYKQGLGVSQNEQRAIEYYIEADERGNKNAAKRLRKLPLRDTLSWWEEKAEDGDKKAILKLMKAYATGDGISKNTYKAKEFYELAYERWPEDADKALASLPANVQLSLSNKTVTGKPSVAAKPTRKPTPVIEDDEEEEDDEDDLTSTVAANSDTKVSTKPMETSTLAATVLAPYSLNDMSSAYYVNGSSEEVKANYLSLLGQSVVILMQISSDKRDIEAGCLSVAGCYALAELNRLTLQFKHGLSAHDIAAIDGKYRRDLHVGVTKLKSLAAISSNSESVELLKATASFMTGGCGESLDNANKNARILKLCDCALKSTVSHLENVRSAADEAQAVKAFKNMACFVVVQTFIMATMPDMALAVNNKTHSSNLSGIRSACERIKAAGYYNSPLLEKVVSDALVAGQP